MNRKSPLIEYTNTVDREGVLSVQKKAGYSYETVYSVSVVGVPSTSGYVYRFDVIPVMENVCDVYGTFTNNFEYRIIFANTEGVTKRTWTGVFYYSSEDSNTSTTNLPVSPSCNPFVVSFIDSHGVWVNWHLPNPSISIEREQNEAIMMRYQRKMRMSVCVNGTQSYTFNLLLSPSEQMSFINDFLMSPYILANNSPVVITTQSFSTQRDLVETSFTLKESIVW